jgi:hypothetical protein
MDAWSGADGKLFQGRIEDETTYVTAPDGDNPFAMSDEDEEGRMDEEEEEEEEDQAQSANDECDGSDCCDGGRQRERGLRAAEERNRAGHPTTGGKAPSHKHSTFQIAPRPPRRAELSTAVTVVPAKSTIPRVDGQRSVSSSRETFSKDHVNWAAIRYDNNRKYLVETLVDDSMTFHCIPKEMARIIWKEELKATAGEENIPLKPIDEETVDLEFRHLLPRDAKGRACLPAVGTQVWRARTRARMMKTEKKEMERMDEAYKAERAASEDEGDLVDYVDCFEEKPRTRMRPRDERPAAQKVAKPKQQRRDNSKKEKEKGSRRKEAKRKASPAATTRVGTPQAKKMRPDEADAQTTAVPPENGDAAAAVPTSRPPERRLVVCSTPAARALSEQLKVVDDPRLVEMKTELERDVKEHEDLQGYLQNVATRDLNDLTALVFCAASLVRFETTGKRAPTRPDTLEAVARIFASGCARYSPEIASSICPITVSVDHQAAMTWDWILRAMTLISSETSGDAAVKDNPFDRVEWAKRGMLEGVKETLRDLGYPNAERIAKWIVVFLIYMFDLTKC